MAVVLFHLNSGHKYLKGKDEQAANNIFVKNINLFVYLRLANESIPFTLTLDIDKCLFRCVLHIITNLATLLSKFFYFTQQRKRQTNILLQLFCSNAEKKP